MESIVSREETGVNKKTHRDMRVVAPDMTPTLPRLEYEEAPKRVCGT